MNSEPANASTVVLNINKTAERKVNVGSYEVVPEQTGSTASRNIML